MRFNSATFIGLLFFTSLCNAEEVFIAKPAKKKSNTALKENIAHQTKQIMHDLNGMIRNVSSLEDFLLTQIQDLLDGVHFFQDIDNKDLQMCMHELEKLSLHIKSVQEQIVKQTHHCFMRRKK